MNERKEQISARLDELAAQGVLRDSWYTYAPGDGRRRWSLGFATYSTREVEAFVAGAKLAIMARDA